MNKELKKILQNNAHKLENSSKNMQAIYRIMFQQEENVLCEENDGFRIKRYTYGQIRQRIEQAASSLYEKIGASHAYVALQMENCTDWIVAFWAILMSGNKPYLVNTRYPGALTNGILKTLDIRYVVCQKHSDLQAQPIAVELLSGSETAVPGDVFEDEIAFSSSATSMNEVICFYSGAQISAQILNFQAVVKENPRIAKHYKGSLKQLAFLPFYHVFGLFAVYFWFTFFGRTLVFLRDYGADTILKTCRRHEVTHIFAVPMLWHTVEQQVWAAAKKQGEKQEAKLRRGIKWMTAVQNLLPGIGPELAKRLMKQVTGQLFGPSVMFCINGGSYLRDSAMELLNGIGYSMHNGYGMSEIGITSVELRSRPKHRNHNSIGHPFTAVEYRLDAEGLLQVRGQTLCTKKLVNGEEVVIKDWFATGDYMICRNGHYHILGRQSDVVIGENGENINPDTVEKAFVLQHVKQLSVLGLPGEKGQELSLIVQVSAYTSQSVIEQIRSQAYAINQQFPATTAVSKFYFTTDEIAPLTAVKISRKQLQKKIEDGAIKIVPFQQMTVSGEKEGEISRMMVEVCRIIAKELDVSEEQIQPNSHIFYDLGATSIQYFSILSSLAEHFSLSGYDQGDAYCYTPKDICQYIERKL